MLKSIFTLLLVAPLAFGAVHEPRSLKVVRDRVTLEARAGKNPIVVFDLDDTLLEVRERMQRILTEFGRTAGKRYPAEAYHFSRISFSQMRYSLEGSLAAMGVKNPALAKEAKEFWSKRYFTSAYCAKDVPVKGAVEYVNSLKRAGATIIYLTGRETASMGEGSRENLLRRGFPLGGKARLVTKPRREIPAHEFKQAALGEIKRQGSVVALFENEPKNLNLMAAMFPKALAIFVDTVRSEAPDVPVSSAYWVRDYTGRDELGHLKDKESDKGNRKSDGGEPTSPQLMK